MVETETDRNQEKRKERRDTLGESRAARSIEHRVALTGVERTLTRRAPCGESAVDMWMDLAGFAGIMALGQMTPGPDWIMVTRAALAHGMRTAVWTSTGIACGLMIHAAVALGGLAIYVRKSEVAWSAMQWLAGGYLLWVAFSLLREGKRGRQLETAGTAGERPFWRGFACNLLNVKVCLLLAAVCATYLQGEHPLHWPVVLWFVIVLQGWVMWIAWAALLQKKSVRKIYGRFRWWLDAGFAAGLLLLAVRLFAGR